MDSSIYIPQVAKLHYYFDFLFIIRENNLENLYFKYYLTRSPGFVI